MTNGIFLGGVAQGLQSGGAGARAEDALALQERGQEFREEQTLETRKQQAIQRTAQLAADVIKASREAGNSPDKTNASIGEILNDLTELGAPAGLISGLQAQAQIPAAAKQTSEDKAIESARAKFAGEQETQRLQTEAGQAAEVAIDTTKLSPGEKKVDQTFAKELVDFNARGGFTDVAKGLDQLREAEATLESGRGDISGPVVGGVEGVAEALGTSLFQTARATREKVAEVVQRNLKLILGAQFSEREGKQLIDRAFNPALEEEENLQRVRRLIGSIESAAVQKRLAIEHFQKFGSLKGFVGELPTAESIRQGTAELPQGVSDEDIEFTMQKHGLTRDQVLERIQR